MCPLVSGGEAHKQGKNQQYHLSSTEGKHLSRGYGVISIFISANKGKHKKSPIY